MTRLNDVQCVNANSTPQPLSHLLAHLHIQRPQFSDCGYQYARKALCRVAEAAGKPPQEILRSDADLLAAHALAAAEIAPKQTGEEVAALRRLLALPRPRRDMAERVYTGSATLADALAAIELQPDPKAWRPCVSAVSTHSRFATHDRSGAGVRADLRALDADLCNESHLAFGMAKSSWASHKSNLRKAVRLVDIRARNSLKASMLSGPWREIVAAAKATPKCGGDLAKIWPLVEFAWRRGLPPTAIDDTDIDGLEEHLQGRAVANPFSVVRDVVYAWERLQKRVTGWPSQKLARRYADPVTRSPYRLQLEDLPVSLQNSWDEYAKRFRDSGTGCLDDCVVDDRTSAPTDPFAALLNRESTSLGSGPATQQPTLAGARHPESLPNFRTVFPYAANAAIDGLSLAPITLGDLMTPEVLNRTLSRRYERLCERAAAQGDAKPNVRSATLKNTVAIFKAMASDLGAAKEVIDEIDGYYDYVHPHIISVRQTGEKEKRRRYSEQRMGPTRVEQMRQFDGAGGLNKLLAWFDLPQQLFEGSQHAQRRRGHLSLEEIADAVTALVAAIQRSAPLRPGNVASLRIRPDGSKPAHLLLSKSGRRRGYLEIPREETKAKRRTIKIELSSFAVRILEFYLAEVRPQLVAAVGADSANPHLFPASGMAHRSRTLLQRHWSNRCKKAGFRLDLHANRHLIGKLILDEDPSKLQLVSTLLDHGSVNTTQRFYAEVNQVLAQRQGQALLLAAERHATQELLCSFKIKESA